MPVRSNVPLGTGETDEAASLGTISTSFIFAQLYINSKRTHTFQNGFGVLIDKLFIHLAAKQDVQLGDFIYIPGYFLATFILFLGLATGIMPAYRAAKIHALDVLRYE